METLPVAIMSTIRQYLGAKGLMVAECLKRSWKAVAHQAGWKAVYQNKFGSSSLALPCILESSKLSLLMSQFLLIVPGDRAGGIRLGAPIAESWSDKLTWEYWIRSARFYELGPAACRFGPHRVRYKERVLRFKVVNESVTGSSRDVMVCEGHLLVGESDGVIDSAMIRCPELGVLQLPNRRQPVNIRVGMLFSHLLALLEFGLGSIEVIGEHFTGVVFEIKNLLGISFTIDCRPRDQWGIMKFNHEVDFVSGTPEIADGFAGTAYLDHPIAEIMVYPASRSCMLRPWPTVVVGHPG